MTELVLNLIFGKPLERWECGGTLCFHKYIVDPGVSPGPTKTYCPHCGNENHRSNAHRETSRRLTRCP